MDFGVMVMKGYSTPLISSELEPNHQIYFIVIHRTPLFRWGVIPCRWYNQRILSPAERAFSAIQHLKTLYVSMHVWKIFCHCILSLSLSLSHSISLSLSLSLSLLRFFSGLGSQTQGHKRERLSGPNVRWRGIVPTCYYANHKYNRLAAIFSSSKWICI